MRRIIKFGEKRVRLRFTKEFRNDRYRTLYNKHSGLEIIEGVNGNPDPFALDFPALLDIGIMGHCKNQCAICYQGHKKEPNMTLENFKQIIDEVKPYVNQVALGGRGDPNLHENFEEIIEYCIKNDVTPNYTTSGINLTKRQAEISKNCGAIAVSDYGSEFTFKAINLFDEIGIKKINVHFVFTKDRFHEALKFAYGHDRWKNFYGYRHAPLVNLERINAVIFLLFKPQGRSIGKIELIPTKEQLKHFADVISEDYPRPFKIGMDSCLVNKIKHKLKTEQHFFVDTCEGARMSAYITPDMRMKPCSFANEAIGESLKGRSIEEIWNESKYFKTFRKILFRNETACPLGL